VVKNVLLMFSSDEPPPPLVEVEWHVEHCQTAGHSWVVTTRVLTGMTPGKSQVAFYGDAHLGNVLLGTAVFLEYLRLGEPRAEEILAGMAIYTEHDIPDGAEGLIYVRDMAQAAPGAQIDSLGGIIVSRGRRNGQRLGLATLPASASRLQVYYRLP
jgi:hypothetical protein